MKIFRALLKWLLLVTALSIALAMLMLFPSVQTWIAQRTLAWLPNVHGSLDWLSAGFGKVEVTNLKLTENGATLTVPRLVASLPVTTVLWKRSLPVRSLVAKGWTLDLSRPPAARDAAGSMEPVAPENSPQATRAIEVWTKVAAARRAACFLLGALHRWALPCDLALNGVDLEGSVTLASSGGRSPIQVQVTIKGGGLAVGHEGTFTIDASSDVLDADYNVTTLAGHGRLTAFMETPRTFSRVQFQTTESIRGGPFPDGTALLLDVAAAHAAGEETYTGNVSRDGRRLAEIAARYPDSGSRLTGTWRIDFGDTDLSPLTPGKTWPSFAMTGNGEFDADTAFATLHALGHIHTVLHQADAVMPIPESAFPADFDTDFDVVQRGRILEVQHLNVSLIKAGSTLATIGALQPFEVDEMSGNPKPAKPDEDWLEVTLHGLPTNWLPGVGEWLTLPEGKIMGECLVRINKKGVALLSKGPLAATGVDVRCADWRVGRRLDLAVSLRGDYGFQGWQLQVSPLKICREGHPLAELTIKASRPHGTGQPIALDASWSANLQTPAFNEAVPIFNFPGGCSASGHFSANLGSSADIEGQLTIVGHDQHHAIDAHLHATMDESGQISFRAPVKFVFGPKVSDISAEGTIIREEMEPHVYLKLTGKEFDLTPWFPLSRTIKVAANTSEAAAAGPTPPSERRDRLPFWGVWVGHIAVGLDHLQASNLNFNRFWSAFDVDPHSWRVSECRGSLDDHQIGNVKGSLTFDADAEFPYALKATGSLDPFQVSSFFPARDADGSPHIEGLFSVAGRLDGKGTCLSNLITRTRKEVRLASTAGIVRVFKTNVDEALPPDTDSPVSDSLGRIGSAVGTFFGVEGAGSGRKTVSRAIQAAIDVVNRMSEIGYDQCTLTALENADHTIQLKEIAMTAGELHVAGSGRINYVKNLPWRSRPLHLELQIGVRGQMAKLFAAAGLLSARKDDLGYTLLKQGVAFGGTPAQIDNREWHELLIQSARRPSK